MTIPIITDPAVRDHVAALSAAVDVEAAKARVAGGKVEDAERRRRELRALLGAHDAAEPDAVPVIADDLATRLAADPAAIASAEWTGRFDDAQSDLAAKRAAWESKRVVIERSVETVHGELPAFERERDDARRRHEAAWSAFVWAAHGALIAQFEREFADMTERLLLPMRALEYARGIYSGARLPYAGSRTLTTDSLVALSIRPPAGSAAIGFSSERLYPPRDETLAGQIELLRDRLEDSPPKQRATR